MKKATKTDITKAGANVPILGNRCYRCSYEWRPKNMEIGSRVCPNCKSVYWDRPRRKRKDNAND